jgi:hypothetical protein
MSALTNTTDALVQVLLPELERLCRNAPQFGSINLRADLHDFGIGRVVLGIETSRRILPRAQREGGDR